MRKEFQDRYASNCILAVEASSEFQEMSIYGWNHGNDNFTSIDLDRETLRDLIDVLMETLGAMDA